MIKMPQHVILITLHFEVGWICALHVWKNMYLYYVRAYIIINGK